MDSISCIPVVDFSEINNLRFDPESSAWMNVAEGIDEALTKTGFVYLKNTGISADLINGAFQCSDDFFNLNQETKVKYRKPFETSIKDMNTDMYNGYVPPGAELEGDADYEHKEVFDLGGNKGRKYPDAHVPDFKRTYESLENELRKLTLRVSQVLGLSLGLEEHDFFLKGLRHLTEPSVENTTILRALYYPAVGEGVKGYQNSTRCAPHTDYGFITLLLMENDAVGLEVKAINGKWISANPIPDTVLVNVGDFLELWSDGRYPATFHRVQLPTDDSAKKSRKSIAFFVNPDDEVNVQALSTKFNATSGVVSKEVWNTLKHIQKRTSTAYSAGL